MENHTVRANLGSFEKAIVQLASNFLVGCVAELMDVKNKFIKFRTSAPAKPDVARWRWLRRARTVSRGIIQCEEGDLNPHGCYPTSPSN